MKLRNKRGAVDPVLLIGGLICVALIIILLITIYTLIIHNQVVGQASYAVKDAGSLIEVAYASPETLRTAYDVPIGGDGFPMVGSFLLNGNGKEICIHPHSEDEMWTEISNKALSAWGAGIATKSIVATRKAIREYSEKVARREAAEMLLKMQKENVIKMIDITSLKKAFDTATDSSKISEKLGTAYTKAHPKAAQTAADSVFKAGVNDESLKTIEKLYAEYPDLIKNADNAAEFARIMESGKAGKEILLETRLGGAGKRLAKNDPDFFYKIASDDVTLDFLKNAETLEKAGIYKNTIDELGTNGIYLRSSIMQRATETEQAFEVFKTAEGYEMSRLLKSRWWKQGAAAEGFRKAVTNADEAAKLHKVAQYNDEFVSMSLLSSGDRYKLMKYAEKTDDTAKIAKLIEKNKKMSTLLGKGDDAVKSAEGLLELKNFNPKFYEIWRGPTTARKVAGKTPLIGSLPGVGTASGVKQANEANKAVRRGLIETTDNFASKVTSEITEETAGEALKPGFWSKMSRMFEGRGIKYELTSKIKDFIDVSRARKAAKYATVAEESAEAGKTKKAMKYAEKAEKLTAKSKIARELSPEVAELAAQAARKPKGFLSRAAAKVSQKIVEKTGGKVIKAMGKGMATGSSMLPIAGALDACQSSGNPAAVAACKVAALVTWGVLVGLDYVFVTLPITSMVHIGHSASEREQKMVSCYNFAGSNDKIYADPQNCQPDSKSLGWEDLGIGQGGLIGMLMGGQTFPFPAPTCTQGAISAGGTAHHVNINGECQDVGGDCPNVYISDPGFPPSWGALKDFKNSFKNLPSNIESLPADVVLGGSTMFCSVIAIVRTSAGIGCYIAFYTALISSFQLAPGATSNFMLGAGIFSHEDYYYMAFPTVINVEREYDPSTGKSWVNIRKGE